MSILAERLLILHASLDASNIAHAFGGAIALAYYTEQPRGTRDIDVNIFVDAAHSDEALDSMPSGIVVTKRDRGIARRDGQVRVMWDDTPVDLFFDTHEFHNIISNTINEVPFEGTTIPILSCESLVVFKAMFNRTRDWADIEAILDAGADDGRGALAHLRRLLGGSDPVTIRLNGLIR